MLVSTQTGVEQTPGSGGACNLAPEACSPHALPGSSFPAPPPWPWPGAVPGLVSSPLPLLTRKPSLGRGLGPPPTLSAGSRRWAPARVPNLQPGPSLIPPAPLKVHPALGEGQLAQPQTSFRCRECPEVTGGGGLGSHAQGLRRGRLGTRPPSAWPRGPAVCRAWIRRPLQPLLLWHCGPRDHLSLPELGPLPAGLLPFSVLGPPSHRAGCQGFSVFCEPGHPFLTI